MVNSEQEEIALHRQLAGEYVRRRSSEGSRVFDRHWNDIILGRLSGCGGGVVLDCCCGDGILLQALSRRFERVAGIDVSEDMLELARQRAPTGCRLVSGTVADMPFDAGEFDAVTFRGAFHHLKDPAGCLREVRRVLRPGGRIVLVEPNGGPLPWRMIRTVYRRLSPRFSAAHRFFRRGELRELLAAAGFEDINIRPVFFAAYPFAGLLDHFHFLSLIPFHAGMTHLLLRVDGFFERLPGIRNLGLALLVSARRSGADTDGP